MSMTFKKCFFVLIVPIGVVIMLTGLIIYSVQMEDVTDPLVRTGLGTVRGLRAEDGEYNVYLGIPYAKVNASNVFGPSIPHQKFTSIYHANDDSFVCPQYDFINKKVIAGTLDCLRLNVYVPHTASSDNNLRPVLLLIAGSNNLSVYYKKSFLGPKFLMQKDIIMVVISYRVGPYGFFCVDDPRTYGNQGLKDQVIALKWVKDNIKCFGGDPNRITLAGARSGGENVNLHLLYGKEDDVFHNVIIDSGIYKDPIENAHEVSPPIALAEYLGCASSTDTEALTFLSSINTTSIIEASMKLNLKYQPCVEIEHDNAFITNRDINSYTMNLKRTPILISHSEKEITGEYHVQNLDEAVDIFETTVDKIFDIEEDISLEDMEDYVRRFYLENATVSSKHGSKVTNFLSDVYANYPTNRMIKKYLNSGSNDIYYGIFTYPGVRSLEKVAYDIDVSTAVTGDVYGYLFDIPLLKKTLDEDEKEVVNVVTMLWANFVKFGNPTPNITQTLPIKWNPVEKSKLNFMDISKSLKLEIAPYNKRITFWELFTKKYGHLKRNHRGVEPWI